MPSLIDIRYCYDLLISQIPVGLLLYAHIPTAIAALLFGTYLIVKTKRSLSSVPLFFLCFSFAIWCFLNLGAWFAFLGSEVTMFTWSLIDIFSVLFFFFSYYFLYTFVKNKDLPLWQKLLGLVTLLPNMYFTFIGANLNTFDLNWCEAIETNLATNFAVYIEQSYLLLIIGFTIKEYFSTKSRDARRKIALAGTGVTVFLFIFFLGLFSEILVSIFGILSFSYNVEIYGLFGMPILLIFLGLLIVKEHAFDIKMFATQALVIALIALVAAQFAFVHDPGGIMLTVVTLVLVSWVGRALSKSVKKEIELREHLEEANKGQTNLIHIMNHQIKNYLSKSRNIFGELISDPSYGVENNNAKSIVKAGFDSLTEAVGFVQQILNGSSAEKGTLVYNKAPLNFREIVEATAGELKSTAESAGLSYDVSYEDGEYTTTGDRIHLKETVKNLIDNSIRYTPKGGLKIHLGHAEGGKIRLTIQDTGVGITPEDKKKLFTKGGRGKDSLKINVYSTGYGLSFVKGVVDAHNGRVWAESEGKDKGSTFYLELPAA